MPCPVWHPAAIPTWHGGALLPGACEGRQRLAANRACSFLICLNKRKLFVRAHAPIQPRSSTGLSYRSVSARRLIPWPSARHRPDTSNWSIPDSAPVHTGAGDHAVMLRRTHRGLFRIAPAGSRYDEDYCTTSIAPVALLLLLLLLLFSGCAKS